MRAFFSLLAFLTHAGAHVQRVSVPLDGNISLDAALVLPRGPVRAPAVVALHGCGGPFASRDGSWALALANAGHIVLLPDSFGSRGLGPQCSVKDRHVRPSGLRRKDAIAAAQWLNRRPDVPSGGIELIGWSNGGGTVLYTATETGDLPAGLFRRFVAFYPGCRTLSRDSGWRPAAPLMILVGESDDWTPAAPCHDLAARFPAEITLLAYPGAYHEFDAPNLPVRLRTGLATAANGNGRAHTGTNERARQDALKSVLAFLEARA